MSYECSRQITLTEMDLRSVAIYSTADARSSHATARDAALSLDGNSISKAYLSGDQFLQLASQLEAQSGVPGHGFLAENADFVPAEEAAGLVWIGPKPEQMRALGLKHQAREIAMTADVPVLVVLIWSRVCTRLWRNGPPRASGHGQEHGRRRWDWASSM